MAVGAIDAKGRFTIPKPLLAAMGLSAGSHVFYTVTNGELTLVKADDPYGPVAKAVIAEYLRGETIGLREWMEAEGDNPDDMEELLRDVTFDD